MEIALPSLVGQDRMMSQLRSAVANDRLHHAWLITGPRGVGKASLARRAALRLLADAAGPLSDLPGLDVDRNHPAAKLFLAGTHPDFRLLKREVWDKQEIVSEAKRDGSKQEARSIRIEQVRAIEAWLSVTGSMSSRRVIIIDSADDLEHASANALLKLLEEPARGVIFFLISHQPARLLPTIRSRCRTMRLSPLDRTDMIDALRQAMPDATTAEIDLLVEAGEGSPGRALSFRGLDLPALDQTLAEIAKGGDPRGRLRSQLAQALANKTALPRYEALLARAPAFIARHARKNAGERSRAALDLWERASRLADDAQRHSLDPAAIAFELGTLVAALAESRKDGRSQGELRQAFD